MMLTVFSSVAVYYLLSVRTPLSENLSMAGGVAVGIVCAAAATKFVKRK